MIADTLSRVHLKDTHKTETQEESTYYVHTVVNIMSVSEEKHGEIRQETDTEITF